MCFFFSRFLNEIFVVVEKIEHFTECNGINGTTKTLIIICSVFSILFADFTANKQQKCLKHCEFNQMTNTIGTDTYTYPKKQRKIGEKD